MGVATGEHSLPTMAMTSQATGDVVHVMSGANDVPLGTRRTHDLIKKEEEEEEEGDEEKKKKTLNKKVRLLAMASTSYSDSGTPRAPSWSASRSPPGPPPIQWTDEALFEHTAENVLKGELLSSGAVEPDSNRENPEK